jgi:hypothetical protein
MIYTLSEKLRIVARRAASLWRYALIICVSLIFDWFIQLTYYIVVTHHNPSAFSGQRTLFDYKTGIIGDVLLVPITNAAILYVLLHAQPKLTKRAYAIVAILGLFTDITLHFMQGYLKLENWSMPKPYEWNFVSYWHMVSFLLQISFIILFFYIAITSGRTFTPKVRWAALCAFLSMGTFIALFLYDYLPR